MDRDGKFNIGEVPIINGFHLDLKFSFRTFAAVTSLSFSPKSEYGPVIYPGTVTND
jgi:hypothetical protein